VRERPTELTPFRSAVGVEIPTRNTSLLPESHRFPLTGSRLERVGQKKEKAAFPGILAVVSRAGRCSHPRSKSFALMHPHGAA
jgi:hypothetical protein